MIHPEQAARWLCCNNFARQRPLRQRHVRYLSQAMTHGRFLEGTKIDFVVWNAQEFLINGQHTLAAIVHSGVPILLCVQRTPVAQEEEIAVRYGRHDRGLSRTLGDSYYAHGFAEQYGFSQEQANKLGQAMPLTLSGISTGSHYSSYLGIYFRDQDCRWAMMSSWSVEARAWFDDLAGTASYLQKTLTRQAVMSVALITYRHTGSDAGEFWREVAKDNGLSSDHPAKTLIRFLLNTHAKRYDPTLYAKYVSATWNAFYTERRLSRVFIKDATQPILLEGTPHTHAKVMVYLLSDGTIVHAPVPEGSA